MRGTGVYSERMPKCIVASKKPQVMNVYKLCRCISFSVIFALCPCHQVGSSRLRVSVLLPGESSVQWKRIGCDIWQFDKVDLVS